MGDCDVSPKKQQVVFNMPKINLDLVRDKQSKRLQRSPTVSPKSPNERPRKLQKSSSKSKLLKSSSGRILGKGMRDLNELNMPGAGAKVNMLDSPRVLDLSPDISPRREKVFIHLWKLISQRKIFRHLNSFAKKTIICNFNIIIPIEEDDSYKIIDVDAGTEIIYINLSLHDLFKQNDLMFDIKHGVFLDGQQLNDARSILKVIGVQCD